jgi:flagellar protein FliO/FliZ
MKFFYFFPLAVILSNIATAGEATGTAAGARLGDSQMSPFLLLKLLFFLAIVIGLIFLAVWIIKKMAPQLNRGGQTSAIKILSSNWLGPKKALFLVEVIDRIILIGVTDNSINTLSEFTSPEEIALVRTKFSEKSPTASFSTVFTQLLQKKGK